MQSIEIEIQSGPIFNFMSALNIEGIVYSRILFTASESNDITEQIQLFIHEIMN